MQRNDSRTLAPAAMAPGVLGFPVMGIWQEGQDGTDYNALARSVQYKSAAGITYIHS